MATTIFDPNVRASLTSRLQAIQPDAPRQWGTLTCNQMMAHVGDQLRMAVGDIACPLGGGPMAHFPMKHLILYVLPWPKAKAKSPPQGFTTDPGEFDADREAVLALIDRLAAQAGSSEWPVSPVFGRMSQTDWGALSAKHLDHHLRQFGA